jgi:hypothetical protein
MVRRDDDEATRAWIGCPRSTIQLSALPAILTAPNRLQCRRAANLAALVRRRQASKSAARHRRLQTIQPFRIAPFVPADGGVYIGKVIDRDGDLDAVGMSL